jgi:hypothetical protein
MSKFKFLQSIKSFNNTVKLSILILFTLITFYTSIIFFNLDPLKLIIASLLFLVVLIFAILIFDKSYFKYKGFDLKDLVLAIITVAFFLLFFVLPPKLKVYFPTFPLLMLDTDAFLHYDTAFHVSIINSILNFGYPSIGQHNSPFLFYHVLSHYIDALIIFFSGLDALESYGLFYYFKFISIFSGVLFLISQILKVNQIYKYLLSLIIFTQLIFGDFHIIASHSLWFTSVIMLFSFSNVINIIKNDENKKKDYLFLILLISIITLGKINYGIIFAIFIRILIKLSLIIKNYFLVLYLLVCGLLIERYINNFFTNFRSSDNLISYIEISKEIQDYKNLIKKNNLDNNSILRSFQIVESKYRGKILNNKFNFSYPEKLDGKAFLNNYALYTKDKTLKEYSNTLKSIIINSLSLYEDQLKIAKRIDLQQPILKQEYTVIINEPDVLFYRGTKVLEEQIDQHKKILLLLTNVKLDYNPVLDKALFESSSSPTLYI